MKPIVSRVIFAASFILPTVAFADDDDVKLDELPEAVRDTVQRETKAGKITEIERDARAAKVQYEVEYVLDNQRYEIHIANDGTVLHREKD